jgi:hypothetical protein
MAHLPILRFYLVSAGRKMRAYLYVTSPPDNTLSFVTQTTMDKIRARTQTLSEEERLKLYFETAHNLNHLRTREATSKHNKQKQAYFIELLDIVLTLFDADRLVPTAYAQLFGVAHPQLGESRLLQSH